MLDYRGAAGRDAIMALAAAVMLLVACSARDNVGDSTATAAAARGDSIGDLSGAPRSADSASPKSGSPAAVGPTSPSSGKPPSAGAGKATPTPTPSNRLPNAPAPDTGAQRRNDGSMMNPPIHRTNPRDDDIMRPVAPGAGTGEPALDLMAEIRALARTTGCAKAADCQTLPVGRKACGGPRTYVVFCPKNTDVAKLRAKIAELERVDLAAAKNTVSDCMMVMPPRVTVSGGSCRAANDATIEVH